MTSHSHEWGWKVLWFIFCESKLSQYDVIVDTPSGLNGLTTDTIVLEPYFIWVLDCFSWGVAGSSINDVISLGLFTHCHTTYRSSQNPRLTPLHSLCRYFWTTGKSISFRVLCQSLSDYVFRIFQSLQRRKEDQSKHSILLSRLKPNELKTALINKIERLLSEHRNWKLG